MPPLPVARFENDLPEIIRLLRKLVEQESPTTEKSAVDTLGALIAGEMRSLGAEVRRYPQTEAGDHWLGDWGEGTGGLSTLWEPWRPCHGGRRRGSCTGRACST